MKHLRNIILIIAMSILSDASSFAQTTYTLSQCIDYALKNHRSIKMAANDVETAYARKREGQSAYMPQVNAQLKWDDNLILQSSVIPALTFGSFTGTGSSIWQSVQHACWYSTRPNVIQLVIYPRNQSHKTWL